MVQAIKVNHHGKIYLTDMELLKKTLDLVLDTIGLPECNNINEGRQMIRDAVSKDRNIEKCIDEVIKLASNIVYGKEDQESVDSHHSIESQLEQIESIKSFVTQNPVNKRLGSEVIVDNDSISLVSFELKSVISEKIELNRQ